MSETTFPTAKPPRKRKALVRRLVNLAKPHWRPLALGTLCLLVGSAMGLGYPQAIGVIVDQAFGEGKNQIIDLAALAMLVMFVIQGIAVGIRSYLFTVTGERIVAELRKYLFEHVLKQEIAFFDQRRTGELLNRLSSDTGVIQNAVSVNISMALRFTASIIGGLALLLYTSVELTGLMLLVVPPVAFAAVNIGRQIRKLSRKSQDALGDAGEIAEESISGIRTVRAFNRENGESKRYEGAIEKAFDVAKFRARIIASFMGGASITGYSAVAAVLWYGGHMVVAQELSVGDLTSFILYTLIVAFSLGALGGLWSNFMQAVGASERVFELIDRNPKIDHHCGLTPGDPIGSIAFKNLNFSYPSRPDITVLRDINFEIAPGEIVALVGPSGSGKSTIAALITRLYDPDSGHITFDNDELSQLDPTWLREQIGVVSQEPILFSTTIEENIRYGKPTTGQQEVLEAAAIANASDFIEEFPEKWQTEVGERGVQLSGGQKQRIAIARAVLKNPRLLILDEATSALDSESEYLVQDALEHLMRNRTTLIIAHRLSTVKNAHRVMVLDDGVLVQSGDHHSLMNESGLYKSLVERQLSA